MIKFTYQLVDIKVDSIFPLSLRRKTFCRWLCRTKIVHHIDLCPHGLPFFHVCESARTLEWFSLLIYCKRTSSTVKLRQFKRLTSRDPTWPHMTTCHVGFCPMSMHFFEILGKWLVIPCHIGLTWPPITHPTVMTLFVTTALMVNISRCYPLQLHVINPASCVMYSVSDSWTGIYRYGWVAEMFSRILT